MAFRSTRCIFVLWLAVAGDLISLSLGLYDADTFAEFAVKFNKDAQENLGITTTSIGEDTGQEKTPQECGADEEESMTQKMYGEDDERDSEADLLLQQAANSFVEVRVEFTRGKSVVCGGVRVGDRQVMTAAHCLRNVADGTAVGENERYLRKVELVTRSEAVPRGDRRPTRGYSTKGYAAPPTTHVFTVGFSPSTPADLTLRFDADLVSRPH